MIEAELPDGTILEFPEGTATDVVQKAVKSRLGDSASKKQTIYTDETIYDPVTGVPISSPTYGPESTGATKAAAKALATAVAAPVAFAQGGSKVMSGLGSILPSDAGRYFKEMGRQGEGLVEGLGEATGSPLLMKASQLGGEIVATAPTGKVLAGGLEKIAPNAKNLAQAIRTSGMAGGNIITRMAGGAIAGGAAAGALNPEDALTGAAIGGILPPAVQVAGMAGKALGERSAKKYAEELAKYNRSEPFRKTVKESVEAGYVIPPNMVQPSTKNAIIESFSGKQATSQIASVKNQQVTEKLVRESLGLADDAPLTKGALEQIRKIEGGAYKNIADLSDEAAQTLEALKQARNDAQGWFNAYNRSASPADLAKAKEFRDMANHLENALEFHATAAGKEELIPALKKARQQIAKTYTVQRSLNDASGAVNAKVIGRMYEKGVPLNGELEKAGKFASSFPSIAQAPQQIGSPGAHNLRSIASLLMGGGGAAAAGPVGLAAAGIPFASGPVSRALMFRKGAQNALAGQAPKLSKASELARIISNQEIQQMLMRSAPIIASQ